MSSLAKMKVMQFARIFDLHHLQSPIRCFHVFTPRTGVTHNPASVWETRVYVQPKVHEDATPAIDGDRRRSVGLILNLRDLHFRS